MASPIAAESWWIKIGAMYDGSGFKAAAGGMLDVTRSAQKLLATFRKIVDTNSDLYLSARYLNMPADALQGWERAFKLMGGTADEAASAIGNLNFVYDKLRLGMDSGTAEIAARLHLTQEDLLSFDNIMVGLNRSYNEMFKGNYGGFKVLAEQLGLSQTAIQLVTQSTEDFNKIRREASSIPMISDEQLHAARELDKMFTKLSITWDAFKSKLVAATFPGLEKLFDSLQNVLMDPKVIASVEELFTTIENGFKSLAGDEKASELIGNLAKITEGGITVAKWTGQAVDYTIDKAEGAGGTIGTLVGTAQTSGWTGVSRLLGLDLVAEYVKNGFKSEAAYAPVDVTQNITIDGTKDPEAVGAAVVDSMAKYANGNANKQMVDTRRLNTVM